MTHDHFQDLAALDAIGAATPDEKQSLEDHLRDCKECRSESDEFTRTASMLALSVDPVVPPAAVRSRVLAVSKESQTDKTVSPDQTVSPDVATVHNLDDHRTRGPSAIWWAVAAGGLVGILGWNQYRMNSLRGELDRGLAAQRRLEEQARVAEGNSRRIAQSHAALVESLKSPETRGFTLTGQKAAPSASARVFLDQKNRRAVVFFNGLGPNPAGKQYELWLIRGDSPKPQGIGVFDVTSDGKASIALDNLPVNTEFKGLAVTLEPYGGGPAPTGEILVSG